MKAQPKRPKFSLAYELIKALRPTNIYHWALLFQGDMLRDISPLNNDD
jgi:hypothetical protein